MLGGVQRTANLVNGQVLFTLNGQINLVVRKDPFTPVVFLYQGTGITAAITQADILASSGVMHVVNRYFWLPRSPPPSPPSNSPPPQQPMQPPPLWPPPYAPPLTLTPFAPLTLTPFATLTLTPFATLSLTPFATLTLTPFATLSLTPFATLTLTPFATLSLTPFAALSLTPFATLTVTQCTTLTLTQHSPLPPVSPLPPTLHNSINQSCSRRYLCLTTLSVAQHHSPAAPFRCLAARPPLAVVDLTTSNTTFVRFLHAFCEDKHFLRVGLHE
ncbi:hypothetical protein V8C86DRAFT_577937 [Haematococcus lacustris]